MNYIFQSNFKDGIISYCDWRESLGFSDDHRRCLYRFDKYCSEFHVDEKVITSQLVTGWLNYEVLNNRSIENKCSAIRSFARYVGNGSYVLKEKFIRYERKFVPYVFTDEELIRLFASCDEVIKEEILSLPKPPDTYSVLSMLAVCGRRKRENCVVAILILLQARYL